MDDKIKEIILQIKELCYSYMGEKIPLTILT